MHPDNVEIVDQPETDETTDAKRPSYWDDPETLWIAHRKADGTEHRMPMLEWPAYARENGL